MVNAASNGSALPAGKNRWWIDFCLVWNFDCAGILRPQTPPSCFVSAQKKQDTVPSRCTTKGTKTFIWEEIRFLQSHRRKHITHKRERITHWWADGAESWWDAVFYMLILQAVFWRGINEILTSIFLWRFRKGASCTVNGSNRSWDTSSTFCTFTRNDPFLDGHAADLLASSHHHRFCLRRVKEKAKSQWRRCRLIERPLLKAWIKTKEAESQERLS